MRLAILLAILIASASAAQAKLVEETIPYEHDGIHLAGHLVYDDVFEGKRPGVLVFHEWRGLDDNAKRSASRLASMGYVAFAADMYGRGVLAPSNQEAAALAKPFKEDRDLMRRRAHAAYVALREHALVEPEKIAAVGFCFGGTAALELARSGLPLSGVVSFHGGLETPAPARAETLKCPILALHGAEDPLVKSAEVAAFEDEMRQARAVWQVNVYGGAVHSFTNPDAGNDPSQGVAYNEAVAARAWDAAALFLSEAFWGRR